ncbi:dihydrolipoamide acetyltransferase family protein [Acetobacterium woodii]|uniref:Dihydrolipoamide acetyltransferase component of pyruvate dehydrogenase complex n=1 Tax=Acetobacterium woodii (strain ATCC 29683 / DSM 1030 / JCM 2381 / KCTC 1655 / WB1) TaxID=931626 RepID=H6LFN4_ACEWD|nr:dihydrolipoamide acetyltransferase family protein [Acetobacterium woodii]AFA46979.1 TPP-dependent acetoin dehydrogenase complex E2 component dihydrolipoamide acetyltransferase AcoC1 [Acetobacterium woodii DSM 1030]
MAQLIVMPKFGLTMTEGTIASWNVAVGDTISEGDILCEIETDKLTNEFESPRAGVLLKIIATEGSEIPCLEPIAIVGEANEDISGLLSDAPTCEAKTDEPVSTTPATTAATAGNATDGRVKASPLAKKLAKEKGLDLQLVIGTGNNGSITVDDVKNYTPASQAADNLTVSPVAKKMAATAGIDLTTINRDGRIMKKDVEPLLSGVHSTEAAPESIVLKGMRKTIAKRMSESWSTSPRVTYTRPVDATALKEFRSKLKPEFNKRGLKLTFNHIMMKICAQTLLEFPHINGSLVDNTLILHPHVHIGLAIGLDSGLLVPNVKNCDLKSLSQIAQETEQLIAEAKAGRTNMDDLTGGTFTLSNLGAYGITSFSPIINQPELAILGIDAMVDTPVVIDSQIVIRPIMNLSLTADHRIIDGALAAQFLQRLAEYLENPALLSV